ncbi:hypothetical protein DERF_004656 [Dermatophagoides farinae]|uniref:Uncharacterized protein n=1 Tax=Dermatophagoides farinae TaxID=6954 RepID=A0A922I2T3_DERFA|nr:hypothetical protein DERF_004656 [Dermatophagoides farinae]
MGNENVKIESQFDGETETKRIDSPATAISQVPVPVSRTISVYDGKVKTLNFRLFSVLYVEDGIFFQ